MIFKLKYPLLTVALMGAFSAQASDLITTGSGALTVGSFSRHDEVIEVITGTENAYLRAGGTRTQAGDYKDGNGVAVHSDYMRWSGNATFGYTPDDNTALELSLAKSDGRASYADRTMDGSKFARDNVGIKFDKKNLSPLFEKVEAHIYRNYIDHVMDNYTMRATAANNFMVSNPDRETTGGRIATTLSLSELTKLIVGLDNQRNIHTSRANTPGNMASAAAATAAYLAKARAADMSFDQTGLFGEATHYVAQDSRVVGGLRVDWHSATDSRTVANSSTSGRTDKTTLKSYFGRYEHDMAGGLGTFYAGLGHAERTPDFWERYKTTVLGSTTAANSSFFIKPEKTTQLDVGTNWKSGAWSGSVSGFYGKVSDYILLNWTNATAQARNISATTMGAEADASYRISSNWKADATLAYVRANNDTDNKPLAQQPPLEVRLGGTYDDKTYSFGVLARLVAEQTRFDINSGNIVNNGKDLGRTGGFGIFSLNAGWRPSKIVQLTGGIDNLFDKVYSENLNKGGTAITGFATLANVRLNEPGRNLWLKANIAFD
jgi:iron complex outermembrane receptor protein